MKPFRLVCIFFLSAVALPQIVTAQSYTFTNIADNTGPFASFSLFAPPKLNNGGAVTFTALLDAGGSGVYRSDGVATTTIADESGPLQGFLFSDINDAGQVVGTMRNITGALGVLLACGRASFGDLLQRPGVSGFWWPRFLRLGRAIRYPVESLDAWAAARAHGGGA